MIKPILKKTLPLLINTYKSVDVRTAAVNLDKVWRNVITTIRFTSKDKRETKLSKSISNEKFKIECFSDSVNGEDEIISQISKGILSHNSSKTYFDFDIKSNIYSIELYEDLYWLITTEKNRVEKTFEGIATHDVKWRETIGLLLKDMSNMTGVTSLGYKDIYDAIKRTLEMTGYSGGNTSLAIVINLPVYAKVRTSVKAQMFNFEVTFHEMLSDMLFIVAPENSQPQPYPVVSDQCEKKTLSLRKFSRTIPLLDRSISARLVFKDAPEVVIWHTDHITPVKKKEKRDPVNPLLRLLKRRTKEV